MITVRIVKNRWGWSLSGIRHWIAAGWCGYCRWGQAPDHRPHRMHNGRQCRKVGPLAVCIPGDPDFGRSDEDYDRMTARPGEMYG